MPVGPTIVTSRRLDRQVYLLSNFEEALRASGSREALLQELGSKGTNLAEMTALGLPVPPGFVITASTCRAFLDGDGKLPVGVWDEVETALRKVQRETGKRFGDSGQPLLLSCRSGSRFSMPGMMDTVLNLGMTDEVAQRLAETTGNERFAFDAFRRLVQMFGHVVAGVPDERFESLLRDRREARGVASDSELPAADLRELTDAFRAIVLEHTGRPFPDDPRVQLRLAIEAVFRSWQGNRAHEYRQATGIPHDLGTAVTIVAMVFGNLGEDSGTGVATTRDVTTGEHVIDGDFLVTAQGEDVVAGTHETRRVAELAEWMPGLWDELKKHAQTLEDHYRDVQDIEFTIEQGKLWMLQTRDSKRTAQAAIRIAVDLAWERRITRQEALLRTRPEHVDYFMHPQFVADGKSRAHLLATGFNVSPGAAIGLAAFDADTAERWARKEGRRVVLVRPQTRPEDVHGLLASEGIVTTRGGRTSHAALIARQFGKPAVVGALNLEVDEAARTLSAADGTTINEGDWMSIDGTTGEVFAGRLPTVVPHIDDDHLEQLLAWADAEREIGIRANADYPADAKRARELGAEGIGLCRTEHMFFQAERLPIVQTLILAEDDEERAKCLEKLLPMQRADFEGVFRAMDGLPVTIRLIDPPLHEFLPNHDELERETSHLETKLSLHLGDERDINQRIDEHHRILGKIDELREENPMLGLRGVRLAIHMPQLARMQVRAIFEAACACRRDKVLVRLKIMIPLTATADELRIERNMLEEVAKSVMTEQKCEVEYEFGTMIEVPRAALTADRLAEHAQFFSFGTNDLTQTTFGISRDDAETGFLTEYLREGILSENPFATIDREGVGQLMRLALERGRKARPELECGICGEHGGDPKSIAFCCELGLDYVSCSPFRVPIARLAAAHATLAMRGSKKPA